MYKKISIDQQIEEIIDALSYVRQRDPAERKTICDFRVERLGAARRTLEWVKANEHDIRAFIAQQKRDNIAEAIGV